MMQMPVKTTLRLYCDESRVVFKCMQRHQCIATHIVIIHLFIKCHCKIARNMFGNRKDLFRNKGYCYVYVWEEVANSGLSTSNLPLSYLILDNCVIFCSIMQTSTFLLTLCTCLVIFDVWVLQKSWLHEDCVRLPNFCSFRTPSFLSLNHEEFVYVMVYI